MSKHAAISGLPLSGSIGAGQTGRQLVGPGIATAILRSHLMRPGPPSWLFSYFGRGPAARARACSTGHGFYNPATCPTTHRLAMPKQVSIYGLHRPSDWSSAKGSATLAGYAVSLWMGLRPSPGLGGPPSWLFSCSVVNHPPGRHHPNHTTKHQTTTRGTPTHSRRPTLARPGPFTRRSALGQPVPRSAVYLSKGL